MTQQVARAQGLPEAEPLPLGYFGQAGFFSLRKAGTT